MRHPLSGAGVEARAAASFVLEWRGLGDAGGAPAAGGLAAGGRAEPLRGAAPGGGEQAVDGGDDVPVADRAGEALPGWLAESVTHSGGCHGSRGRALVAVPACCVGRLRLADPPVPPVAPALAPTASAPSPRPRASRPPRAP